VGDYEVVLALGRKRSHVRVPVPTIRNVPTNALDYWDSPASVAEFGAEPFLWLGERSALSVFARLQTSAPRRVLDLGCGGGRLAYFLASSEFLASGERWGGNNVLGLDPSRGLIRVARRICPAAEFCVGLAEELPFRDGSLDLVAVGGNPLSLVYPAAARDRALGEVARVIRPGGCLLVSHHNMNAILFGWFRFMRPAKLRWRAQQILTGVPFRRGAYIAGPEVASLLTYWIWPRPFVADLRARCFEPVGIFPNSRLLAWAQRALGTSVFSAYLDKFPYYLFRKIGPT
jgi:SAM-dependent methyltransferase